MFQVCACVNLNVSSAVGSDGEESRRLLVCSRNPSVPPLHRYGWSLLHCCHDLGVHTHEAQVHMHTGALIWMITVLCSSILWPSLFKGQLAEFIRQSSFSPVFPDRKQKLKMDPKNGFSHLPLRASQCSLFALSCLAHPVKLLQHNKKRRQDRQAGSSVSCACTWLLCCF